MSSGIFQHNKLQAKVWGSPEEKFASEFMTYRAIKILAKRDPVARANFRWVPEGLLVRHWYKIAADSSLDANSYNLPNYM